MYRHARPAALALAGLALLAGAGAAAAACLTDSDELRAVLAAPAAEKQGRVYCLAPGRYTDLTERDFEGAFVGLDPAAPVTFMAEDPADPPVLNMWQFSIAYRDRAPGVESGDVILRDLDFDLTDVPEVPVGQDGFRGHRNAVGMSVGGITRNVVIERIRVRGGLRDGSDGARETTLMLNGVIGLRLRNVAIIDSRFEGILNAITVAGENLIISRNRMRHSWGDLIRIVPQVIAGGGCNDTVGVLVRDNMMQDLWANNRQHPDVVHMFPSYNVSCNIRDVLIEGTLAFPGATGMDNPGFPTSVQNTVPRPAPAVLPDTPRVLHRLTGPGRTQLPPARCPDEAIDLAVQRDGTATEDFTLVPAPGERLTLGRNGALPELDFDSPWETWRLRCMPNNQGNWTLIRHLPGLQGIFANSIPEAAGYQNIVLRHNILWALGRAVTFRDPDNRNIAVLRNSFLRVWPGDADGDGVANTFDDGFREGLPLAQIFLDGGEGFVVRGNVANAPLTISPRLNDSGLRHDDGGRALIQRFETRPGPALMPTTPQEAVDLARPRAGGLLDGFPLGAVGRTPAQDPYDWSWVAEPW